VVFRDWAVIEDFPLCERCTGIIIFLFTVCAELFFVMTRYTQVYVNLMFNGLVVNVNLKNNG
jgi:hypothetical protein